MRTKKSKLRAGKTTCRRCKTVFWRAKGERHRICEWCRAHCARCDRQLPIEAIKPECITCQAETTHNIAAGKRAKDTARSEEHTSELQSHSDLVCRLLLEKKKKKNSHNNEAR